MGRYSEPLQLVHRQAAIELKVEDISHLSDEQQEMKLVQWMEEQQQREFDIAQPGLICFYIHKRSENSFQFSKMEHHAILDGWSEALLLTEMFGRYFSALAGREWRAQELRSRFRDSIELEQDILTSEEARTYWLEQLTDVTVGRMPWKKFKNEVRPGSLSVDVTEELSEKLKKLAQNQGVSIKTVLLAAHLRVMSLLAGQNDIITGLVMNGRPEAQDGDQILGLFLNTVPLRMHLRGGRWTDLIQATSAAELEVLPYRRYPLQELQLLAGKTELFEVGFNYTHFHVVRELKQLGGLKVLSAFRFGHTNFPLMVDFALDLGLERVQLTLNYNAAMMDGDQIERIGSYYGNALRAMAGDAQARYENVRLWTHPP
jgi:hypothetical protein